MKAKDIKDYIQLYIGCEVVVMLYDEYTYPGEIKGITESETEPGKTIAIVGKPFLEFYVEEVKPILRPLSSMTEEEKIEVAKLAGYRWARHYDKVEYIIHDRGVKGLSGFGGGVFIQVTSDGISFTDVFRYQNGEGDYYCPNQYEITRYLLSKGFDLYNLIESNLAVASNK